MLTEICAEIRNYFTYEDDKHFGEFAIINGQITPSFDIPTDYIRIVGSHRNDGVHVRGEHGFELINEDTFDGSIWVMSPPKAFIDLAAEIAAWQEKYGGVDSQAMSPFNSESFGGYSYSKSAGTGAAGVGAANNWVSAFAGRLNIYRKIRL